MSKKMLFQKLILSLKGMKQVEKGQRISTNLRFGSYSYGIPQNSQIRYADQASLEIGKFCSIADNLKIMLGGGHRLDLLSTFPFGHIDSFESNFKITSHPTTKGDVLVGNDVWIGSNVTIMSGVRVGNGAVIAANSHVVKHVGSYEIWGGNPAKFIRFRVKPELIQRVNALNWWEWCEYRINFFGDLFCLPLDEHVLNELELAKQFSDCCDDGCSKV